MDQVAPLQFPQDAEPLSHAGRHLRLWFERLMLTLVTLAYLIVFRREIPSGDAEVYVGNLDTSGIVINPNHLLMDPITWLVDRGIQIVGLPLSVLDGLAIIAGGACIAAILVFHGLLARVGVQQAPHRLLLTLTLFACNYFLTMATSEEFFMLLMPFICWSLWGLLDWLDDCGGNAHGNRALIVAGLNLGMASLILASNVFLLAAIAVFVTIRAWRRHGLATGLLNASAVAGPAGALGLATIVLSYQLAQPGVGIVDWLLAYKGVADNPAGELYGLEPSLSGLLFSGARAAHAMVATFVDTGGLGSLLKGVLFTEHQDFVVNPTALGVSLATLAAVLIGSALFAYWLLYRQWRTPLMALWTAWVLGVLAFNLLWNDSSDQFWFQILPPTIIAIGLWLARPEGSAWHRSAAAPGRHRFAILAIAVVATASVNTANTVAPLAFANLPEKRAAHAELLEPGDLEIVPGWDGKEWLSLPDDTANRHQLTLMSLALGEHPSINTPRHLRRVIDEHLANGHRVIVARLYDLDTNPRPWAHLRKLGWSRERLQALLSDYTAEPAGEIDGVGFRELIR